ncbi:MAG: hypothetical protein ACO3DJ_16055 [Alphaproteobacteria bacterium]
MQDFAEGAAHHRRGLAEHGDAAADGGIGGDRGLDLARGLRVDLAVDIGHQHHVVDPGGPFHRVRIPLA